MAKQQVVAELHSYQGMDTSLLVNGRKDGRMWVIITIPDDPKDECVIDCGHQSSSGLNTTLRRSTSS